MADMNWKPIETAPLNEWVLVYYIGAMEGVSIALLDGVWVDWDGDVYGKPTHWMPMPAAPLS